MTLTPSQIESRAKRCPVCNAEFHRPKNWGTKQWEARRFCSTRCGALGNSRPRSGGLIISGGRLWIVCRDGISYAYARGVMEAHLRRPLRSDEIVHHINGNSMDDRIENLALTDRAAHIRMHSAEIAAGRRAKRLAA